MKQKYIANILIIFGLVTFLASLIDMSIILFPLNLSSPDWVYLSTQQISDRIVVPMLGLVMILLGFYFSCFKDEFIKIRLEKTIGIISFVIGLGLIISSLFYVLVLNSIENQVIMSVKQKNENIKKQIAISYIQQNLAKQGITIEEGLKNKNIPMPKEVKSYFEKIDKNLKIEIKSTKLSLLKKNIKVIFNQILFIIAFLYIGINSLKLANFEAKQLILSKTEKNNQ
ncbi:MAG: hypothetical protein PHC34_09730 [Candidatus Gastranaerophilales bacterium]|nr:hypothetical protein [Candidatus Gastranaerophilales bacterium]